MKVLAPFSAFFLALTLAATAHADPLSVANDDTIVKVLAAQAGKVVTLKLCGSDELTGKIKSASSELVVLSELTGKEFYDAAVVTKNISAVIVRAR